MHIGIDETPTAGPGDCHIKGGYVSGAPTWTVKLACVSFYKNVAEGMPAGGGIFIVMNAKNGAPLAVIQENRFLTDVRTGAAGAVSVKHLSKPTDKNIGFIGTGAIAKSMARATAVVRPGYTGYAYGHDAAMSKQFCEDMKKVMNWPKGLTEKLYIYNINLASVITPSCTTLMPLKRKHYTNGMRRGNLSISVYIYRSNN